MSKHVWQILDLSKHMRSTCKPEPKTLTRTHTSALKNTVASVCAWPSHGRNVIWGPYVLQSDFLLPQSSLSMTLRVRKMKFKFVRKVSGLLSICRKSATIMRVGTMNTVFRDPIPSNSLAPLTAAKKALLAMFSILIMHLTMRQCSWSATCWIMDTK